MNVLLVLAGLALMAVGITWQIGRWLGFWRLLALVGIGEAASIATSARRQSLAAADLAQELRLLRRGPGSCQGTGNDREARINPWGRPSPARQGTSSGVATSRACSGMGQ